MLMAKIGQTFSKMATIFKVSCQMKLSSHHTFFWYCPDQGDIVGREYIHDSKKGVMWSQFHLTRALVFTKNGINDHFGAKIFIFAVFFVK
jgi:hypothetical protein